MKAVLHYTASSDVSHPESVVVVDDGNTVADETAANIAPADAPASSSLLTSVTKSYRHGTNDIKCASSVTSLLLGSAFVCTTQIIVCIHPSCLETFPSFSSVSIGTSTPMSSSPWLVSLSYHPHTPSQSWSHPYYYYRGMQPVPCSHFYFWSLLLMLQRVYRYTGEDKDYGRKQYQRNKMTN